jgi:SAM-dependent methyltransferase
VHARYRVDGQIFYESIDARAIPYVAAFDIVVFKSMLGGVGGNGTFEIARKVIDQTYRALRPGGLLLFAENLAATALHQLARTHFAAGKLGWRYFTVAEIREMVAEFSVVDYMTCGFLGCFGRSESQRNLLGRLDRALLGRLVPRDWRYIMIVAARK